MEKLRKGLARYVGDLVLVAGAAAITVGAGMIYLPAGLIAGGVLAIAGVILNSLGGGDGTVSMCKGLRTASPVPHQAESPDGGGPGLLGLQRRSRRHRRPMPGN